MRYASFSNALNIYDYRTYVRIVNNDNTVLFGAKDTGHTVISTDLYPFIAEIIKKYVETNSPEAVKKMIRENEKTVLF